MASIATPLLQRKRDPEEEQLLKLFWNRAELKKELARLRRDKEKLLDQLRDLENVNLRAQQRLEQLENLLAEPLQAANALVYYQLRGVWSLCRRRLGRLARELSDRQQEREERHALVRFEQERDGQIALIDQKLGHLAERARHIDADLHQVVEQQRQLRGFWNHFRRRSLAERVEAVTAAREGLKSQIERLQGERRERELESPPGFPGLGIEGRRNINLALIAMSQQLLVDLAAHNVAGLAREAAMRAVTDVTYGSAVECAALSRTIEQVVRDLDTDEKVSAAVRRRAEYLRGRAQFRREADTVPVAGSFAVVPLAISDRGDPLPSDERVIPVNVLADEYWDIYAILLS